MAACGEYVDDLMSDVDAWERFAVEVLGLEVGERKADGSLTLRMDERAQRIALHPGPADDLTYLGFEVDDEASLRTLAEDLAGAGIAADTLGQHRRGVRGCRIGPFAGLDGGRQAVQNGHGRTRRGVPAVSLCQPAP